MFITHGTLRLGDRSKLFVATLERATRPRVALKPAGGDTRPHKLSSVLSPGCWARNQHGGGGELGGLGQTRPITRGLLCSVTFVFFFYNNGHIVQAKDKCRAGLSQVLGSIISNVFLIWISIAYALFIKLITNNNAQSLVQPELTSLIVYGSTGTNLSNKF